MNKRFTITLSDAEMGLLIILLMESNMRDGTMVFEDVLTKEMANSSEVLAKLINERMPHSTRRVQ